MTPETFSAWLDRLHLKNVEAARLLGCGINQITRYTNGKAKIPRYIALACAAIAQNLKPWGES